MPKAGANDQVRPAVRMKPRDVIEESLLELLTRRRKEEADDTKAITVSTKVQNIWNSWCKDFIHNQLSEQQRQYKYSQQSSIFNAHIKKRYGNKCFVMALLQTGLSWVPASKKSAKMSSTGTDDCEKSLTLGFMNWMQRLLHSIEVHKQTDEYKVARRKSGNEYRQSGLTSKERACRDFKSNVVREYRFAKSLYKRYTDGNETTWYSFSRHERHLLTEYMDGWLDRKVDLAKQAHGGPVRARAFVMSSP